MIKQRSHILYVWFMIWDVALTAAAWVAAYYVRFETGWVPITKPPPDISLCLRNLPLVMLVAAIAYRLTGQYEIHRLRHFYEEIFSVLKGTVLVALLMMAATFYTRDPYVSRASMILFSVLTPLLILIMRRMSWNAIRGLRGRGYNQTYAIIVGTGRVARLTARYLRRAGWLGIKPLGFVDDERNRWNNDLDILGGTEDLPGLIEKYQAAYVFVCLPFSRFQEMRRVFEGLSQTLTEVRLVADMPALVGWSLGVAPLDNMTMISLRESPHFGINVVVKRVMDVALSITALTLLSPLLLLIAALVKLTGRGPVFFKQERCSLNGRSFQMLKFRSMRTDAEAETGAVWARKDDPRRTKIGAFLRKTSLDELPQLFNVLMGDMSLVGPRPERPVFIDRFSRTIPNYMARHAVKCGITGWAQVHGWRGNTSLRKRLQYDLFYITNWSPWLDLRIMWLTVVRALFDRNAY